MQTTKRRVAVYCLESSDTTDTPVEVGAAVLAGAPDPEDNRLTARFWLQN